MSIPTVPEKYLNLKKLAIAEAALAILIFIFQVLASRLFSFHLDHFFFLFLSASL